MPGWAKDGEQLIDFSNQIPWNVLVNTSCFLSNVLCLIWWDDFSFYIHRSEIRPSGARMDSTKLQLNVSPRGCNWNKAELKQIGSTTVRWYLWASPFWHNWAVRPPSCITFRWGWILSYSNKLLRTVSLYHRQWDLSPYLNSSLQRDGLFSRLKQSYNL